PSAPTDLKALAPSKELSQQAALVKTETTQDKIEQAIEKLSSFNPTKTPNQLKILPNLGSLYAQKQQWNAAITAYKQAIAIDPEFAGVYRNLGRVLDRLGKAEEASQYWFKALSLEPERVTAQEHFQLGNTLLDQKRVSQAVTCYQRAIELKPDYAASYHQLGQILVQQGKLKKRSLFTVKQRLIILKMLILITYWVNYGQPKKTGKKLKNATNKL
ncbi:MAG: tetratricopeptide repeat protein, partial [Hydrococcus sp. SU_1_0]|nr:tetratricopeptide repeat protein [Hydrococcus sp. SU_1_0]